MNQDDIIRMAREACPYTTDEMRGAFYEGFLKGAVAKREPLTDQEMEQIHQQYGGNIKKIMRAVEAAHGIKGEA